MQVAHYRQTSENSDVRFTVHDPDTVCLFKHAQIAPGSKVDISSGVRSGKHTHTQKKGEKKTRKLAAN